MKRTLARNNEVRNFQKKQTCFQSFQTCSRGGDQGTLRFFLPQNTKIISLMKDEFHGNLKGPLKIKLLIDLYYEIPKLFFGSTKKTASSDVFHEFPREILIDLYRLYGSLGKGFMSRPAGPGFHVAQFSMI